ncbi:ABC transporter substrate-binding protein [Ramlibacter tataouinensis]|uniref:ABC transporter substrate-binding protein n=1 Tax=Ramlibacter tataouinensis TaxID=94132 RepID=A0A140HL91_9BURK|nr:ABC transporter substrate-binding protein [Ramlibacter tataouinensis]
MTLTCLAAALPAAGAWAADFPSKPVSLVVPFAPGGPTDAMARTLGTALKAQLGQPVIVENKAGAGGNVGAEAVARAEPDGHTILFGTSGPLAINGMLYQKINYDPVRSFSPVIQVGYLPNVLAINASIPARNLKELIAYIKANPGKLSYASSGNGASSHLAGALFNMRAGTDVQHVPYRGTGPALNDLLAGQVAMAFTDVLTALPHAKAGKLRILGVTTATRSRALPEVPTLMEQGLKDFDVSVFFGMVVPAGTPQATVTRLNAAFAQILQQPAVRQSLQSQGLELPNDLTPAQLAVYMRKEQEKWRDVIAASGAKAD